MEDFTYLMQGPPQHSNEESAEGSTNVQPIHQKRKFQKARNGQDGRKRSNEEAKGDQMLNLMIRCGSETFIGKKANELLD